MQRTFRIYVTQRFLKVLYRSCVAVPNADPKLPVRRHNPPHPIIHAIAPPTSSCFIIVSLFIVFMKFSPFKSIVFSFYRKYAPLATAVPAPDVPTQKTPHATKQAPSPPTSALDVDVLFITCILLPPFSLVLY